MSDEKLVPFFGMEVEPDALVKLFFHAPLAGEADLAGGVVRSGGRWWGGGRIKVCASNDPGDTGGASVEVNLDIDVIGAAAPGAAQVVYFAPNNGDQGFVDAISAAAHATPTPIAISISTATVRSISWGSRPAARQASSTVSRSGATPAGLFPVCRYHAFQAST